MHTQPSRLSIRLLGPVEVTVDGAALKVDTKKAVALLAYLAAGAHRHSRDHVCDLFWPDSSPDKARAALRRTLSVLRSALGERWVQADRASVWFEKGAEVDVDLDRFSRVVGDGQIGHDHGEAGEAHLDALVEASSLIRGQFLQGFGIRGCPDFDDWMVRESQRVERMATGVHRRLTEALLDSGRLDDALDAATRWIVLDPLSEDAHRQVMLAHAWHGDRAAASRAYRSLVELLDRELGVEPLETTTELYEAILEGDLPPVPTTKPRATAHAPVAHERDLVGRDEAIGTILDVLATGHGLVVVDGEVGVGKTRLLDELVRRVGRDQIMVTARAHRLESGVAYGPVQAALREAIRSGGKDRIDALPAAVRAQAARLVPALGSPSEEGPTDPTAKGRFLDGVARTLGSFAPTTILAIDDLHWCDDATLEFISYLAGRLEELGVVVIVTRRPEDTPAEHPVTMLVEDLTTRATTIRLDRLTPDQVGILVAQAGVPHLDPAVVYERSRGLPFFIVEYLAAARAGHTELPSAIRRLLLGRLAELDSIGRQIVTTMAIVGTACDLDTLRTVSGRSEEEALTALDELLRRGMLRESGPVFDFAHEQLREVAYAETSLARRRLLHRRVAEYLVHSSAADRDPVAIANAALHRLEAGDTEEARHLSLRAGDLAAGVFANADALTHYETALALDPESPLPHLRLGEIRTRTGDYAQALLSFQTARTRLLRDGREGEAAAAAHAIGEIYRRLGRWELAAQAYAEAIQGADTDVLEALIYSNWAYVLHRSGRETHARETAEQARDCAETSGDGLAMAHAYNLSGLLAPDQETKRAHLDRALALAEDPRTRMAILNNLALACAESGDPTEALRYGSDALAEATLVGDIHRLAALHDNLADFHHQLGDEPAAMAELKQAVSFFARIDAEPGERVPEVWLLKEW